MKLTGSYTFDAPQEIVWEMLQDPDVLGRIMPGAQKLEKVGENQFKGKLKIKIGPVQGNFQGTVDLLNQEPPNAYDMKVNGRGPAGFMNGTGHVQLEEKDGKTIMTYDGDAKVGGRIASVGQRLMDSSAKAIVKQSLQGLEQQIEARMAAEKQQAISEQPSAVSEGDPAVPKSDNQSQPTNDDNNIPNTEHRIPNTAPEPPPLNYTPPPPPPPPSQTEFALGVAQEVLADFLDEDQQKVVAFGLITILGLMLWRRLMNKLTEKTARRVVELLNE